MLPVVSRQKTTSIEGGRGRGTGAAWVRSAGERKKSPADRTTRHAGRQIRRSGMEDTPGFKMHCLSAVEKRRLPVSLLERTVGLQRESEGIDRTKRLLHSRAILARRIGFGKG